MTTLPIGKPQLKFRHNRFRAIANILLVLGIQVYLVRVSVLVYTDWWGEYEGTVGRHALAAPFALLIMLHPLNQQFLKYLRNSVALKLTEVGFELLRDDEPLFVRWKDVKAIDGNKRSLILGCIPWRHGVSVEYVDRNGDFDKVLISPLTIDFMDADIEPLMKGLWKISCADH